MRRAALFLAFLLCASPALAATNYYFSGCAVGCLVSGATCGGNVGNKGTVGDPWCLDPENTGHKYSWSLMQDGVAGSTTRVPEAVAGDTINLCAGACDSSITAETWFVEPSVKECQGGSNGGSACSVNSDCNSSVCTFNAFIAPRIDGPVTVQAFCSGGVCDNVTMVGDTNNNGAYDQANQGTFYASDVLSWMTDLVHEPNNWTLNGDPLGTDTIAAHTQHIILTKVNGTAFDLARGGLHDFTFNGIDESKDHVLMWAGASQGAEQDACGQSGHYTFHIDDWAAGTIKISHSTFHDLCSFLLRANWTGGVTPPANSAFNFTDNDLYNVGSPSISNAFSVHSWPSTATFDYARNRIRDSGPVSFHDNWQRVTIEDNDIGCPGVNSASETNGCQGIIFHWGTTPNCSQTCVGGSQAGVDCAGNSNTCTSGGGSCSGPSDCSMDAITIRRNKMWGTATLGFNSGVPQVGALDIGIVFDGWYDHGGATSFPVGILIENNEVWNQHGRFNQISCPSNGVQSSRDWLAAIYVATRTSGVVVRNNTAIYSDFPLYICGETNLPTGSAVDNLLYRADRSGSHSGPELLVTANASAWTLSNNNANTGGLSGSPISWNGTTYACGSVGAFNTAAPGDNNICATATFANIAGSQSTWNLDLSGAQLSIDAGIAGAADDIHGTGRPQNVVWDIGAYERPLGGPPARRRIVVVSSP